MFRTALLVVTVVLAGCLGGVGGGSDAGPSEAAAGPPDAAWTSGDGIDTTRLAQRHFEALRAAGSFTVGRSETVRVDGDPRPTARPEGYSPPSEVTHRVDLDDGRYLDAYVTVGGARSDHFVTPRVTARRRADCPDCAYTYSFQRRPGGDTGAERLDRYRRERVVEQFARTLRGVSVGFDYSYAGTVRRGGETLHRYRAERTLDSAPPPFAEPPRGTATVRVTDDGVVRRFELEYRGPATVTVDGAERRVTATQTFVQTYTAVGGTTVDRPAWVDRAAAADAPRTTVTGGS